MPSAEELIWPSEFCKTSETANTELIWAIKHKFATLAFYEIWCPFTAYTK